ncbi:MAG: SRPBCC domain-containing protein [Bacteroidetes bacterium]|nr:SRPBCC domain-containing protein [Bacteroidota bacterium]
MFTIKTEILINSPVSLVWKHLSTTALVQKWIGEPEMNIQIITDWEVGSPIIIKGFHHINFINQGTILKFEPNKILQYNQLDSISNLPDMEENYSILTFQLSSINDQTLLQIDIENFPTETIYKHLNLYWRTTIELIKHIIEND